MNIEEILEQQRAFFRSGATLSVDFRIESLKKLYNAVQKYQREIGEALTEDLGKSDFEGFMCETGLVLSELHYMIRHTRSFARERRVHTPLASLRPEVSGSPPPMGTR